jgi:hypothetical protein
VTAMTHAKMMAHRAIVWVRLFINISYQVRS